MVSLLTDPFSLMVCYANNILLHVLDLMQGIMYGAVGFTCGIVGQGIANLIMTAKRYVYSSESACRQWHEC